MKKTKLQRALSLALTGVLAAGIIASFAACGDVSENDTIAPEVTDNIIVDLPKGEDESTTAESTTAPETTAATTAVEKTTAAPTKAPTKPAQKPTKPVQKPTKPPWHPQLLL